jgi:hypothetical protein
MIGAHRRALRVGAVVLGLGLLATACGSSSGTAKGKVEESTTTTTIAKGPDSTAAQLRAKLAGLLQEHVYLAAAASGARGRPDESAAAVSALGGNADALAANFTAIFTGPDAAVAKQFPDLWKGDLSQNANAIGALLSSALPPLSADAVAGPLTAGEQAAAKPADFSGLRTAAGQMVTLGSTLVGAIAKKYPDNIGGDPTSKASELLTGMSVALREHAYLLCAATDAAVAGRADEFNAAKSAVDANSAAVTDAMAGVFGADAGKTFGPLWTKHIGFIYDYANAVAAKQQAQADGAMANLLAYADDFGAFINGGLPKVSKDSAAGLITAHASILKDVMDAQAAKNWTKAYASERTAADHMSMVATTLVAAIVAQFPQNY